MDRLFEGLTTPLIADACLSLGVPIRVAPTGIRSVVPVQRISGRALAVRHYGSVDVFLEALDRAESGDVLVVDNAGRMDEGCIGDLITLEVQAAGLSGIVIWGAHRDSAEITEIGFPVFSYGACAVGPRRLDGRDAELFDPIRFGEDTVSKDDLVFADSDGVLFVASDDAQKVSAAAQIIARRERKQADQARAGKTLREQLQFSDYLLWRKNDPAYTFRTHLNRIGGAIEK